MLLQRTLVRPELAGSSRGKGKFQLRHSPSAHRKFLISVTFGPKKKYLSYDNWPPEYLAMDAISEGNTTPPLMANKLPARRRRFALLRSAIDYHFVLRRVKAILSFYGLSLLRQAEQVLGPIGWLNVYDDFDAGAVGDFRAMHSSTPAQRLTDTQFGA
jgi:hypothetical protein